MTTMPYAGQHTDNIDDYIEEVPYILNGAEQGYDYKGTWSPCSLSLV
jgi:hypothetical protein